MMNILKSFLRNFPWSKAIHACRACFISQFAFCFQMTSTSLNSWVAWILKSVWSLSCWKQNTWIDNVLHKYLLSVPPFGSGGINVVNGGRPGMKIAGEGRRSFWRKQERLWEGRMLTCGPTPNPSKSLQGHKVSALPYSVPYMLVISFLPCLLRFHDSLLPNPLCAAWPLYQGAEGPFP